MEADLNALSNSTVTQNEKTGQTTDATLSEQSFSTAVPPPPTDAEAPAPAELAELPTEIVLAVPAETFATATPAEAAASTASTLAEAPSPASAAPPVQPFPQAAPVQAFMPAEAIGYSGTPAFPPVYTGALPQPGYPMAYAQLAPGQMQPQSAAPVAKKRGRLVLWIVLIAIVLLLLAGSNTATYALSHQPTPKAVVVHHTSAQPQPNGTLQTYCQGVTTSNAEEIYNLLSAQARVHTSLDDIQKTFDQIKLLNSTGSMSIQYTDCTFDNIRVSSPLAVATITLTVTITMQAVIQNQKQNQIVTETVPSLTSLVWESNQWKIDFSQFAQPQPTFGLSGLPSGFSSR